LDDGARRAREQLGDQPVIQATLLDVIAGAYWELGLVEEGLTLRLEALERWREQAKASDEHRIDLVDAVARAGNYLAGDGRLEASRALLEEGETLLAALPREDARRRANILNDLGMAWQIQGDFDRAEPFLEGAAEGFRQIPGQELSAAAAMGNLGWLRLERSDPDSAEALFTAALAMRREALGPDHLFVANTLEGLGNLYVLTRRLAQADTAYRESLRIRRAGLPEDHHLVHISTMGLARVVGRKGDAAEADSLFRRAIAGLVRTFGDASAATAYARNEYAIFLRDQGRTEEAVSEFGRAQEDYGAVYGVDHLNSALVGANRAWALFLDGRAAEAASTFEAVLPVILEADGGSGRFRHNQVEYGIVLCNDGRPDRGVQTLREAVEILEQASPGEDQLLRGKNALGECLAIARRPGEAEPVLLEVLEATRGRPTDDPYRAFARRTLERVYRAQGRDEEARRIREGR
jgi:tetratricopeptide (TPR) repeat protein